MWVFWYLFGWLLNDRQVQHTEIEWSKCGWCGYEFENMIAKDSLDYCKKMEEEGLTIRVCKAAESCPRCQHWVVLDLLLTHQHNNEGANK
ncbi:hypothetical protein M0R72_10545 [Candidatus Pacearchaeota archaeon]|jgi:hypothetical protein|nr:hypothetical protein [Candidatus Pacearchaeota archaeon]